VAVSRPNPPDDAQAHALKTAEAPEDALIPTWQTRRKIEEELEKLPADGRTRMALNMGPQHPSLHGVLRVVVEFEGERIVQAWPIIGYLHRNFEKLCETMTYPMVIPFSDRNDYAGPVSTEIAITSAVEKLHGIEVPRRAQYLRIIMAELSRIANHLLWFGAFGADLGAFTPFLYCFRDREMVYDLWEHISGARMLPGFVRVGGVRSDMPAEWPGMLRDFTSQILEHSLDEYKDLLMNNGIFKRRTEGVGVLTAEEVIAYGCSGPLLRGSGVDWDLRRDDPILPYSDFEWRVPLRQEGDVNARAWIRIEEIGESAKIINQAIDKMPEGPVMADVPRRIMPPAGDVYARYEGPKGEFGVYLVSDGSLNPYRVKLRAPGFVHLQTVQLMAPGGLVADLIAELGSLDLVMGEVDR